MNLALIETPATPTDRLRHSIELRREADINEVRAIAELAAEHSWTTTDEFDIVGERAIRLGADGTRLVGEFLPMEVAAIKGISVNAATGLIRDVLNLEARHPVLWDAVRAGHVAPFRAFQLARLATDYQLSQEQAIEVDSKLAGKFGRIGWPRLMRLAHGLIAIFAGDTHEQRTREAREARFMRSAPDKNHPIVTELWARLDTADAEQLEATVAALAKILAGQGDTDSLDVRRSKALGILATPAYAANLLAGGDGTPANPDSTAVRKPRPRAIVNLNLAEETITGSTGVARSDTLGPITKNQLAELFGTYHITINPIIRVDGDEAVDAYEIPDRIRKAVNLRDVCEVFPYSSRNARHLDLDHTIPYVDGATGQTRPGNLGPLSRNVHRAKTAGRWKLRQPRPGVFWWKSPDGQQYRVTPEGTDDLHHWSPLERLINWKLDTG